MDRWREGGREGERENDINYIEIMTLIIVSYLS